MAGPRTARLAVLAPLLLVGVGLAPTVPAQAGPAPEVGRAQAAASIDPALRTGRSPSVPVIVQLRPGTTGDAARREVQRLGGRVTHELPVVDGFAARVPRSAVTALGQAPDVAVLSADRQVRVQAAPVEAATATPAVAPSVVRAPGAWAAGATGRGVTVALVDTGIADVPDLAGRVLPVRDDLGLTSGPCLDLSGEHTCRDSYGHGTFMAGLIAGNGAGRGGVPTGTAPQATLLSVKIAGPSGAADVSTVLSAVQWVVSYRARYGIDVLNLSLGTDSTQSWKDDPLNYAVERAWQAGIVVVVAGANNGPAPGSISKPGDDPYVITVGAVDDRGTVPIGDDRVPDFSSRGPTRQGVAKPDVVAPGGHVLSLRSAGSTIEKTYGTGASPYRRASGTSMAAALVSGVAATTLQAHPALTPDQVKHVLTRTARPAGSRDLSAVGTGVVDARAAAAAPPAGSANAGLARSTGRGSLLASRGSVIVQLDDPDRTVMDGRQTAQLLTWDPIGYTTGLWTPLTWTAVPGRLLGWNTAHWYGDFQGHNWTGHNWTGSSFYGEHESSSSYGRPGNGSASYGAWD